MRRGRVLAIAAMFGLLTAWALFFHHNVRRGRGLNEQASLSNGGLWLRVLAQESGGALPGSVEGLDVFPDGFADRVEYRPGLTLNDDPGLAALWQRRPGPGGRL